MPRCWFWWVFFNGSSLKQTTLSSPLFFLSLFFFICSSSSEQNLTHTERQKNLSPPHPRHLHTTTDQSSDPPSSPSFQNQETNFSIQIIPTKNTHQNFQFNQSPKQTSTQNKHNPNYTKNKLGRMFVYGYCRFSSPFPLSAPSFQSQAHTKKKKKIQETNFSNRTIPTKNLYKFHR